MPMTLGMAIQLPLDAVPGGRLLEQWGGATAPPFPPAAVTAARMFGYALQVLAGVHHALDVALLFLRLAHERLDVDDALALLAGDLRPVVRVRGVRQILVLLELLAHGEHEVIRLDALFALADVALERELLGAPHDGLDHRPRREVLEVQDLLIAVGIRDLEEAVLLAEAVHRLDRLRDHGVDGRLRVTAV